MLNLKRGSSDRKSSTKDKPDPSISAKILETDLSTSIFQLNENGGRVTRRVFWEELCSFEETAGFVAIERSESALFGGIDTDLWRPLERLS